MNKPFDCFKFGLHPLWTAIPLRNHSPDTGLFEVCMIYVLCNQFIVALLFSGSCSEMYFSPKQSHSEDHTEQTEATSGEDHC